VGFHTEPLVLRAHSGSDRRDSSSTERRVGVRPFEAGAARRVRPRNEGATAAVPGSPKETTGRLPGRTPAPSGITRRMRASTSGWITTLMLPCRSSLPMPTAAAVSGLGRQGNPQHRPAAHALTLLCPGRHPIPAAARPDRQQRPHDRPGQHDGPRADVQVLCQPARRADVPHRKDVLGERRREGRHGRSIPRPPPTSICRTASIPNPATVSAGRRLLIAGNKGLVP
jgi:hypothetical protein